MLRGTPVLVVQEKRYWGQRKAGAQEGNSQIWGGPQCQMMRKKPWEDLLSSVSALCLPLRLLLHSLSFFFFFSLVSHQPTFFFYQFYLIVDNWRWSQGTVLLPTEHNVISLSLTSSFHYVANVYYKIKVHLLQLASRRVISSVFFFKLLSQVSLPLLSSLRGLSIEGLSCMEGEGGIPHGGHDELGMGYTEQISNLSK